MRREEDLWGGIIPFTDARNFEAADLLTRDYCDQRFPLIVSTAAGARTTPQPHLT